MSELDDLKAKVIEYESALGIGKNTIERSAFFALCKMIRSQTVILNKFNLYTEITVNTKDDKLYDRTMDIVKGLPKMISEINNLRKELGITDKESAEDVPFVETFAETRK